MSAQKNSVFLVSFKIQNDSDNFIQKVVSDCFDSDHLPQVFDDLNRAKSWIQNLVDKVLAAIHQNISPDWVFHPDTDDAPGYSDYTFGYGDGAHRPWLIVDDASGATVNFFIHTTICH